MAVFYRIVTYLRHGWVARRHRTMGVLAHYLSDKPEGDRAAVMGGNAKRFYKTGELV